MHLLAPAKINLHLRVGPRRADGFHSLMSWMCTVGLFDILNLEATAQPASDDGPVRLSCDLPGLPCDASNLVTRVATAWIELMRGEQSPASHFAGVRATLAKRIPMGGGLGGGSSDGATSLIGLNRLWGAGWTAQRMSEFAAIFGSDLSFFFHGSSSVCTGRGEFVIPIARPRPKSALLVLPEMVMPTGPVYRRFDAMGLGRDDDVRREPDWSAWTSMDAMHLLPMLVNDLEQPAFDLSNDLSQLRDRAEQVLRRPVRMSGSGSTLFTIFDTSAESLEFARVVTGQLRVRAVSVDLAPDLSSE